MSWVWHSHWHRQKVYHSYICICWNTAYCSRLKLIWYFCYIKSFCTAIRQIWAVHFFSRFSYIAVFLRYLLGPDLNVTTAARDGDRKGEQLCTISGLRIWCVEAYYERSENEQVLSKPTIESRTQRCSTCTRAIRSSLWNEWPVMTSLEVAAALQIKPWPFPSEGN